MTVLRSSDDQRARDHAKIEALTARRSGQHAPRSSKESLIVRLLVAVLAPLWLTVILLIVLIRLARGRRPALVLHARCGYQRQPLFIPKIATSTVPGNSKHFAGLIEVATGPNATLTLDGRFEHWLRATGLDELPQLFLIVVGKMRLVGPRPVTRSELDEMAVDANGHGQPVAVDTLQPGLLGLWQILDRHAYELDERNQLDMRMVSSWSRRLCFSIVGHAIGQVARRCVGADNGTSSSTIDLTNESQR